MCTITGSRATLRRDRYRHQFSGFGISYVQSCWYPHRSGKHVLLINWHRVVTPIVISASGWSKQLVHHSGCVVLASIVKPIDAVLSYAGHHRCVVLPAPSPLRYQRRAVLPFADCEVITITINSGRCQCNSTLL